MVDRAITLPKEHCLQGTLKIYATVYHRLQESSWGNIRLDSWVNALQRVLQKYREYNVPTHHLFIDFKSAYDTIDREQLWQIMHEYGFSDKLIRLIKATMDRVMCVVRVSGTLSSSFESLRGQRQGDGLSCLLFNIAFESVVRRARINTSGTIFTKSVQLLGLADDIDNKARKFETMLETYIRLNNEAR